VNVGRLFSLLLILSVLIGACVTPEPPTPTPAQTGVPRFESTDCWFEEPQGQEVECGYLVVPEDRDRPDGKTIRVAVARFESSSPTPAPDPIVYLEGGPGGSPLRSLLDQFGVLFEPFLETRDLILVDQRGTGYSQPALDCPEYTELSLALLDDDLTQAQAEEQLDAALLACRERLVEEGVNLAAYNSAENAADLNDLRRALAIDEWNLYGISYGTRLALTALRDTPEGIRSAVIDSVVPPQADLYAELPSSAARAFDLLFDTCAADPACSADFPDLRAVFFDLVDRLNATSVIFPVRLESGAETDFLLNGDGLMELVFQSLYATPVIPLLPRMIYAARDGDHRMVSALESAFLEQLDDISYGMHFSVQCGEEAPFSSPERLEDTIKQHPEYAALAERGTFELCTAWGAAEPDSVENQAVSSDVPTLVLGGEFDPITPPAWAQLAAQTLANSHYFELPNAGHGASLTGGECPRNLVLAFFEDPASRPDASCIAADMEDMAYARALDRLEIGLVSFESDLMGFSGAVPGGWREVAPGAYTPSGSLFDQRAILLQALPVSAEMFLGLMTEQLQGAGAEVEFEEIGSRSANGLDWTLYSAEESISAIDLALAERDGKTYVVLMQSVIDERDVLYDRLFLPVIDALTPQ